jgi:hypothetical protein
VLKLAGAAVAGVAGAAALRTIPAAAVEPAAKGAREWNVVTHGGARGDGRADDGPAIQGTIDAARAAGAVRVYFPAGVYAINQTIDARNVWLEGAGMFRCLIEQKKRLGPGVPSIISGWDPVPASRIAGVERLSIWGPGSRQLGKRTADCDGLRIDSKTKVSDVQIRFFDSGCVFNCPEGHITLDNCDIGDNYYGIYFKIDNGDHLISDCTINGNTFANIAVPYDQFLGGLMILRSHVGFAPYAIYHEKAPQGKQAMGLMAGCTFLHPIFEAIGNGAIFTENQPVNSPAGSMGGCMITDYAFYWHDGYRIPDRRRDYAIELGALDGISTIAGMGAYTFVNGDKGTLYANLVNDGGGLIWTGSGDYNVPIIDIVHAPPGPSVWYQSKHMAEWAGSNTIFAGGTSQTIATHFAGRVPDLFPVVTPTSDGGLKAFTLIVTNLQSTPKEGTRFTVSVVGGRPKSNLTFYWRLV